MALLLEFPFLHHWIWVRFPALSKILGFESMANQIDGHKCHGRHYHVSNCLQPGLHRVIDGVAQPTVERRPGFGAPVLFWPALQRIHATNKLALASRVTLEKIHAEILLQTCIKRCRTSKKLNPFLVTRKKVRSRFTWFQLHLATENEITPDWLRCLRVEGPAGAPTQCPVMVTHLMSNSLFFTSWTRNINNLTNI